MTEDTVHGEGYFGPFGGQFEPETLMTAVRALAREFESAMADDSFKAELDRCLREIAGRPSELYYSRRFTEQLGGAGAVGGFWLSRRIHHARLHHGEAKTEGP